MYVNHDQGAKWDAKMLKKNQVCWQQHSQGNKQRLPKTESTDVDKAMAKLDKDLGIKPSKTGTNGTM